MADDYEIVRFTPSGQAPPSPAESAMLDEIKRRESSGDYGAKNPDSTASGAYQFINSTWKYASDKTGMPQYDRAADAPGWVQDANALHMLRSYGPNSTITWAASGPYSAPKVTTPASGGDYEIVGYRPGPPQSQTPAPPAPAAQTPPSYGQQLQQFLTPGPSSVFDSPLDTITQGLKRGAQAVSEGLGIPQLLDMAGGATRDPVRTQQAWDTFKSLFSPKALVAGGVAEANRIRDALSGVDQSVRTGDVSGYFRHVGSVAAGPVGGILQQAADEWDRGDHAGAIGHAIDAVAPFAFGGGGEEAPPGGPSGPTLADHIDTLKTAVQGAKQGVLDVLPDAAKGAAEKAGYGAFGGPHAAVIAAKTGFLKEAIPAAISGAKQALADRAAAASAAAQASEAASLAAMRQRIQAFEDWERLTGRAPEPPLGLPPGPSRILVTPPPDTAPPPVGTAIPGDTSGVAAVPGQYPDVEAGFTPPAQTPPAAPEPPATALNFDDLALSLTGKSGSRLTRAERATVQSIYDRITKGVPERPISGSDAALPQPGPQSGEPPTAPQTPPAAPEAPAAPMTPPAPPEPPTTPPAGAQSITLTPDMTPAQAQAAFEAAKSGAILEPLPADVPGHYRDLQLREGTSNAVRAYLKDRRVAEYVLGKGITPEQWEAMPLDQQNSLIREAPTASGKGKHRPFLPEPEGGAPASMGRWAAEGVQNIADTMRTIQDRGEGPPPAPAAPGEPAPAPQSPPAAAAPSDLEQQLAASLGMTSAQAEQAFQAAKVGKAPDIQLPGLRERLNQAADEAQGRIDQFWKDQASGTTPNIGLPVHVLADYAMVGARKILDGAERFTEWSQAMLDHFGPQIQPHLRKIWGDAQHIAGAVGWGPGGGQEMPLGKRLTVQAGPVAEEAPAIAQNPKLHLVQNHLDKLDTFHQRNPEMFANNENYIRGMNELFQPQSGRVPIPPENLIAYSSGTPALDASIDEVAPGQRGLASEGLAEAAKTRKALEEGKVTPSESALYFAWGALSPGLSPYPQEAGFLHALSGGIGHWIDLAAKGQFNESTLPAYLEWSKDVLKGSPGAQATANLNSFGRQFLMNAGKIVENGPYKGMRTIDAIHQLLADPELTTVEARRRYQQINNGLGIDNKVFSFIRLVTGHFDTLVADRVRINDFWDAPGLERKGLAYTTDERGNMQPTRNLYDNGLNEAWNGVTGLGMYEAAERGLAERIRKAYADRGIDDGTLGRWHWETWLAKSGQEVSHGSLGAIAKLSEGLTPAEATVGEGVRQGKYNDLSYGVRYEKTPEGFRYKWEKSDGSSVALTPEQHTEMLETLREMRDKKQLAGYTEKERVIPYGTKTSQATGAPWRELPGVNKQALDRLLDRISAGEGVLAK